MMTDNLQHWVQRVSGWLVFTALGISLLLICGFPSAQNQSAKDKLLDKKKKIEEEINYYRNLLNETGKNKKASINQLLILKQQISKREELIGGINDEIYALDSRISSNLREIDRANAQLISMKDEYAALIYNSYKTRSDADRLMYLFAARDFNQAFLRMKYFQQYNAYRRMQVEAIMRTKGLIQDKTRELLAEKNNKQELLTTSEQEKEKLRLEKEKKDKDVAQLRQKEKDLRQKLKKKEEEARKLRQKIEAAISDEIKKSANKSNKTVTSGTTVKNVLTPEEKIISDNFSGNKGRLPWPVERGVITGTFGEHPHPVLEGIRVKNNGIDISTNTGAAARAVLGGTVSSIIAITNTNRAVILRHGEFFTVYSNLDNITVRKGQNVSTKQTIGTVAYNPDEDKTEIHFEIWQGRTICNPAEWLSR